MECPNCKTQLSCSCQKKFAPDGKEVCTNCITYYTAIHNIQNPASLNSPTNVKIIYNPPKTNKS